MRHTAWRAIGTLEVPRSSHKSRPNLGFFPLGYVNATPTTNIGQIVTVIYGLFGIPLMVLTAVDYGRFLSDIVLLLYSKLAKYSNKAMRISGCLAAAARKKVCPCFAHGAASRTGVLSGQHKRPSRNKVAGRRSGGRSERSAEETEAAVVGQL